MGHTTTAKKIDIKPPVALSSDVCSRWFAIKVFDAQKQLPQEPAIGEGDHDETADRPIGQKTPRNHPLPALTIFPSLQASLRHLPSYQRKVVKQSLAPGVAGT